MTDLKIQNSFSCFFESIYSALFEPFTFYEQLSSSWPKNTIHLLYSAIIVGLVSGLSVFLFDSASVEMLTGWSVFSVLATGTFGLLVWLLTAVIFASLAYGFRSQGRLGLLLTLIGYAMLPWFLMAPLSMLYDAFSLNNEVLALAIIFTGLVVLWLWTTILFLGAVQKTYSLSFDRVLLVSAVPFMIIALGVVWLLGGISSIFTLFG